MVKGDLVVQHKLETAAEWEAHTEPNAPKDWLFGEPADPPSPVASASQHATRSLQRARARVHPLRAQSWKYTPRGAGRLRRSNRH
jgi:hypothetical protein